MPGLAVCEAWLRERIESSVCPREAILQCIGQRSLFQRVELLRRRGRNGRWASFEISLCFTAPRSKKVRCLMMRGKPPLPLEVRKTCLMKVASNVSIDRATLQHKPSNRASRAALSFGCERMLTFPLVQYEQIQRIYNYRLRYTKARRKRGEPPQLSARTKHSN
jgi:hypothetical protein